VVGGGVLWEVREGTRGTRELWEGVGGLRGVQGVVKACERWEGTGRCQMARICKSFQVQEGVEEWCEKAS